MASQKMTWKEKYVIWEIRDRKRKQQNHKCFYCSHPFRDNPEKNNRKKCTADHLTPICKGGERFAENNIVAACAKCNSSKGDMSYDEYIIAMTKPKISLQYDKKKRERFFKLRSEVEYRNRPLSFKEMVYKFFNIQPERSFVIVPI